MAIKIAICDDSAEEIQRLKGALSAYDPTFEFTTYTNGETLIDDFMDQHISIDILFLDIYMPGMDGVQTAQEIRKRYKDLKIVFVSSSLEHFQQAYAVFAFNYIVKPYEKEQLIRVLERLLDEIRREQGYKIHFNYKSIVYSVDCKEILYFESKDKLILVYLSDGNFLHRFGKLDEIIGELPGQCFVRCHQSFIINLSHVTEMGQNYFRIRNHLINISKKYLKSSKDQYYAYLFLFLEGGQNL